MDLKLNDTVFFGSYYRDENCGTKKEPVKWIIVDEDEDSFLLLSDLILDGRAFDTWDPVKFEVTWETSEIRQWLNGEFLETLLNEEEKGIVRLHEYKVFPNKVPLKPDFRKVFGKDLGLNQDSAVVGKTTSTMDCVSLLSWEDISHFRLCRPDDKLQQQYVRLMKIYGDRDILDIFSCRLDVAAYKTSYACAKMDPRYGEKWICPQYWLRSPGSTSHAMAFAFQGNANRLGMEYNEVLGVRPIMWVSKDGITKIEEQRLQRLEEEKEQAREKRRQARARREEMERQTKQAELKQKAEEQLRTRKRWWEN